LRRLLVLLPFALLVTGCAYFNTFYNARRSYDDALRSIAANPDNPSEAEATSLRSAIEGAGKVLSFYPGSRWADDAQLLVADALYLLGTRTTSGSGTSNLEEAMRAYAAAIMVSDDQEMRDRASLGMGLAAMRLGRPGDAAASFESVTTGDRRLYVISRIHLSQALLLERRAGDAMAALDSASVRIPGDSLRGEVLLAGGAVLLALGMPDSAATVDMEAAREFGRGQGNYRAMIAAAGALVEAGRPSDAASVLQDLRATYRSDREMADISLLTGRAGEAAGMRDEALAAYRDAADLDRSGEFGAEALYRRAGMLEDEGDLRGALGDLQELSGRSQDLLWTRLAADRAGDLALLLQYSDSLEAGAEGSEDILALLVAEKRIDLYGADLQALAALRELASSAGDRVRAMSMARLAAFPGMDADSSHALLVRAAALADSGDLATSIEDALGLPRGRGWQSRPSVVLDRAWRMMDEADYTEAWTLLAGALGTRWSDDLRPELLWAACAAAEGASLEDDLVEGYLQELVLRYPGTAEGAAASERLGSYEGGEEE